MVNTRILADKAAIALSIICSLHCLMMPILIIGLPAMAGWFITDEAFHVWMIYLVLPISLYALSLGFVKHRNYYPICVGAVGLSILVFAASAGHEILGETWETVVTLLGAVCVAYSHINNNKLSKATPQNTEIGAS